MAETREYLCLSCAHNKVCKYVEEYTSAVDAIRNAKLYPNCEDRLMKEQKVESLDFIEIIVPQCKHYQKNTPVARDLHYDGPIFSKGE